MRSLLLLISCSAAFAAPPFSLEQVMSRPFVESLTAAPAGGGVAWIVSAKGARNIWTASPPAYSGRQVTSYTQDDGQEINEITWTPDGRTIVYVRGGDFERTAEAPNPRSNPEGVEQAVFLIRADGGEPRRLGEGRAPAVSPKGERVAFLNKGQIWWVAIEGSDKPAQAVHARGNAHSLHWSPDGSRLAFVSDRGNHSFIGVFDPAAKSLRYLDPSVDLDSQPVWSPDSKQVAFIRSAASQDATVFGPKRSGQPWSVRVADAASGAGRQVWHAEEGRGSLFHAVVASQQLIWMAGDILVFPWERDGWVHLYSVPLAGGMVTQLTPGEFEVEHVSPSPGGKEVLYSSNQGDIDRRHIWKVAVSGGRPSPVTSGGGIEWSPVMTSDREAVAFLQSGARRPSHAAIRVGSGPVKELAPQTIPSEFPEASLVEPEQVMISAADGMPIHTQVFMPADHKPGVKYPAIAFFHGGSRRQMLLGWHYMYYYNNCYAMNQYLANQGYIVLSVNYRSGIGYGLDFREAKDYGATGASEYHDVMGAGLYLRSRPDVDPARIGLWGGSYGGYLTALGLSRASDLYAAGVDLHGVHDWNVATRNFSPSYDPQKAADVARVAFESSPMASVKNWRSPVLLIHGDDDRNVPFSETVTLVEALRRQHVPFEQLIFPDEVHDFLEHSRWLEAYRAAADFFHKHLGKS
uniref:Acyl-peptide hydrolase n=1 Tax=uncultured bacterium 89 TaxID=698393 RepID=E3T696_9BACT|nr:peptidase S9 prolyl oligopeptidase [uncultured bacterium 89]